MQNEDLTKITPGMDTHLGEIRINRFGNEYYDPDYISTVPEGKTKEKELPLY